MITYTVHPDGPSWKIVQGTSTYAGYRSEISASKAAVAVATTVGLTGETATVVLWKADGSSKSVFASDPETPSLDSMLLAADELVRNIPGQVQKDARAKIAPGAGRS